MRAGLERTRLLLVRTARAVKIVIAHDSIPKPIRWLAAFGLLPVPGPFDEAVLVCVAVILAVFYRDQLRAAWKEAGEPSGEKRDDEKSEPREASR